MHLLKNFYLRRKIFLIVLIILILILPLIYILFTVFSPGLDINANLNLDNGAILIININNNSSHAVNDLQIYLNSKLMYDSNILDTNSKLDFEFPLTQEKNILIVKANNHLDYEKNFSVNKNALQNDILDFLPEYIFSSINEISDINMTICAKEDLNVNLEIDVTDLEYNKIDNITLLNGNCITKNYPLIFVNEGLKKVRFKIYNDVYSKELLIFGTVNSD